MPFIGIRCPECRSRHLQKRRRSGVRYQEIINDTGLRVGEYRFYHLRCMECRFEFFIKDKHLYNQEKYEGYITPKQVINESEFLKASQHKPGSERIGSTASEFTLKIAAGADRPYALKYLELLNGGKHHDKQDSEGFDLFAGKIPGRDGSDC